jgi:hypothetical protein
MALNMSKKNEENRADIQASEDQYGNYSNVEIMCAGCEKAKPEYILEDRPLCFDCYKAEKYYCAKEG